LAIGPSRRRLFMRALAENVKNAITGTIRGTGEVVNAVTETVSGSLTTALEGTGSVGKARDCGPGGERLV
jgi:hypothetical protein